MAVIVQYIVVRNGEQKMTFTSKKEADAYDKLLDISDQMYTFLESSKLGMSSEQLEELSFYLAKIAKRLWVCCAVAKFQKSRLPLRQIAKLSKPQKSKKQHLVALRL